MRYQPRAIAATVLCLFTLLAGCTKEKTQLPEPNAYVGSDRCAQCHETQHERWADSGHPYKVVRVEGEAPVDAYPDHAEYPRDAVDPPGAADWSEIPYVIGGFGWKLRFLDENGYVVTSGAAGDLVQYNFETDEWATYHTDAEPGTKPYDCGQCHTTGWIADADAATDNDLSDNQGGLPGIHGTFFAGGIHCEACHGPGQLHASSQDPALIVRDDSSRLCGGCHTRDAENRIAAAGGFISHHEQYDEWLQSPHGVVGGPGCNACHDPHASTLLDDAAKGQGIIARCTDCHDDYDFVDHNRIPDCVDCHMPKAAKSAVAISDYRADVRSHIVAINSAAVGKAEGLFTPEGDFVQLDGDGMAAMTLDFACYSCHANPDGGGGNQLPLTLEELSQRAIGIHDAPPLTRR